MPRAKPVTPLDEDRRLMVVKNLPIAKAVAGEYARQVSCQADRDDIFGAAMLGLCNAAASYNPSRGHEFHAYAFKCCRNESLSELLDGGVIRTKKYLRLKAGKGHRRRAAHDRIRSMEWGGDGDLAAATDRQPTPPSLAEWHEAEAAIHALPAHERRAVEMALDGRSKVEIGNALGISRDGARKIQRRVAVRLKDAGLLGGG